MGSKVRKVNETSDLLLTFRKENTQRQGYHEYLCWGTNNKDLYLVLTQSRITGIQEGDTLLVKGRTIDKDGWTDVIADRVVPHIANSRGVGSLPTPEKIQEEELFRQFLEDVSKMDTDYLITMIHHATKVLYMREVAGK